LELPRRSARRLHLDTARTASSPLALLRLAYLTVTNAFTFLRLLPMADREKDIEILALRHQLLVLRRQVGKPAFTQADRAFLAGLLHGLPTGRLHRLMVLVRPDTILCGHRDLLKRRHTATCAPKRRGRPVPCQNSFMAADQQIFAG
jgi:putative transposase